MRVHSHTVTLLEKRWSCQPENVQQAREEVRVFAIRFDSEESGLIELAIGEACANAIEHGSPQGECNAFTLRCLLDTAKCELIFEVEDEGGRKPLPKLSSVTTPDLLSEGGRGLFLITQIMDKVAIRRAPRGARLRMTKRLQDKHTAIPPTWQGAG